MISHEEVLAARKAIGGRLHRTPLFSSRALSERIGAEAHLKAELFQRTGSFKPRGMLVKVMSLSADEKARGIVTWSAGNAGQGAAYAAQELGVACRVFMWRTANPLKIQGTLSYGAEVDLDSEGPAEAHERLLRVRREDRRDVRSPVRRSRCSRPATGHSDWRSWKTWPKWRRSSCRSLEAG